MEIISELAAKQLNLPSQVVFDAVLTRERMGSTGIGSFRYLYDLRYVGDGTDIDTDWDFPVISASYRLCISKKIGDT